MITNMLAYFMQEAMSPKRKFVDPAGIPRIDNLNTKLTFPIYLGVP